MQSWLRVTDRMRPTSGSDSRVPDPGIGFCPTLVFRHGYNIQLPTTYSNAQWDAILEHMRVRANLTGADQRAIASY